MRSKLIYFFILVPISLFSQSKGDYVWPLGYNYDVSTPELEANILDFNGSRNAYEFALGANMGHNNTAISDEEGNLLFYANGCVVLDSTHQIMMNGDSINPGEYADSRCESKGSYPLIQNSIILPDPGNELGYYYLHSALEFFFEPDVNLTVFDQYYTYIDFTNNPLGEVTQKNVRYLPKQKYSSSNTTACINPEGTGWWFFKQKYESSLHYLLLLDNKGIHVVDSFDLGEPIAGNDSGGSQASFSPNGEYHATYFSLNELRIVNFDRSSGAISNYNVIDIEEIGKTLGGLAFSPNSRFIYLTAYDRLFQVDLWDSDIQASVTLIDTFDGYTNPLPARFDRMQLGPDCKIYICSGNTTNVLHVINKPNEKGVACNFKQHDLLLPNNNDGSSLPNFPHFRMNEDDICDPTITNVFGYSINIAEPLVISPNPSSEFINIKRNVGLNTNYQVSNLLGQIVAEGMIAGKEQTINVSDLKPGGYFLSILEKGKWSTIKFIKE